LQKLSRLAGDARDRFGGEVSTAHSSFHRCRPTCRGPIAGKKHIPNAGSLAWAPAIDAGLWRKSGGCFFYDRGLHKVGISSSGQSLTDLLQAQVDDFLTRLL